MNYPLKEEGLRHDSERDEVPPPYLPPAGAVIIFLKADVSGYTAVRGGSAVTVKPYSNKVQRKPAVLPVRRARKDTATADLFRTPSPPPALVMGQEQARHPERFTPDLFTGQTAAEAEAPVRQRLAEFLGRIDGLAYEQARREQMALADAADAVSKEFGREVFAATQKRMKPRAEGIVKLRSAGHDPRQFAPYTGQGDRPAAIKESRLLESPPQASPATAADRNRDRVSTDFARANYAHGQHHLMSQQEFLREAQAYEARYAEGAEPNPRKKRGARNRAMGRFNPGAHIHQHRQGVENALKNGQRMHPRALDAYPDLKEKHIGS